jgi:hypothetical protein
MIAPISDNLLNPYGYFLVGSFLLKRSEKKDNARARLSPKSWTASDKIAVLFVSIPPKISMIEKLKFSKKAIPMLLGL